MKKVTRERAGDSASMRWWKKRMVFCNGEHTGSNFARHESEQTSYPGASMRENLYNQRNRGKQMMAFIASALLAATYLGSLL